MIFSAVPELECFGSGSAVESNSETESVHGATVKVARAIRLHFSCIVYNVFYSGLHSICSSRSGSCAHQPRPTVPKVNLLQACSWQTDCKNPDCEGKCIVNIYQDLNDQAAPSPGQMDHNQDTIARDTKLAWGLTCPMIASTVYRYADKHAKGRPVLDSLKELSAPGMVCLCTIMDHHICQT